MGHYKYTQTKYLEGLLAGQLRFGNVRYYQLMEALSGDDWIGDLNEARRITHWEYGVINDDSAAEDVALAEAFMGSKIPKGATLVASNNILIQEVPAFVFSMAQGDEAVARARFATEKTGYDAGVEITDPTALLELIRNGVIAEDGRKVSDAFSVDWKMVEYGDNSSKLEDGILPPSAFIKLPKYSEQRESRYVLYPKGSESADALTVLVTDAEKCLTEMFRTNVQRETGTPTPAFDLPTQVKKINEIREIVRGLEATRDAEKKIFEQSLAVFSSDSWHRRNAERDEIDKKYRLSLEQQVVPIIKPVYAELRKNGYGSPRIDDIFRHYRPGLDGAHLVTYMKYLFTEIAPENPQDNAFFPWHSKQ